MKESNIYLESGLLIFQILTLCLLISKCGYIFGFLIFIKLVFSYKLFMKCIMKLEQLKVGDKLLLSDKLSEKQNILVEMKFENYSEIDIVNLIKEKGFKKIEKLSCRLVYKLFNFYWEKSNLSEAELYNQRIFIHEPHTYEEIQNFKRRELNNILNVYEKPIEFHLFKEKIENEDENVSNKTSNTGYIVIKFDHCFSDGLSMLTLLLSVSDEYNKDLFPRVMHNNFSNILMKIAEFLLFIFFGVPIIIYLLLTVKSQFKLTKNKKCDITGFTDPIIFNFDEFKQVSKQINTSINELIISLILSSVNKYKEFLGIENSSENSNILVEIPVGLKEIPETAKDVTISNEIFAFFNIFQIIKHPIKDLQILRDDYKRMIRKSILTKVGAIGNTFLAEILPFHIAKHLCNDLFRKIDLLVTNVPTLTKEICLSGDNKNKLVSIIPISTLGVMNNFFICISYANQMCITICYDDNGEFKHEEFKKFMKISINEILDVLNEDKIEIDNDNSTKNKKNDIEMKNNLL